MIYGNNEIHSSSNKIESILRTYSLNGPSLTILTSFDGFQQNSRFKVKTVKPISKNMEMYPSPNCLCVVYRLTAPNNQMPPNFHNCNSVPMPSRVCAFLAVLLLICPRLPPPAAPVRAMDSTLIRVDRPGSSTNQYEP